MRAKWSAPIRKYWKVSEQMMVKYCDLVLIRTDKGMKAFETINSKLKLKEVAYEDGVRGNPAEYKSCHRPPQRDTFFEDMSIMEFEELEKKYASPIKVTFKSRVKRKIKNTIKSALRAIGGGTESISTTKNMDYSLCFVFDCQEQSV